MTIITSLEDLEALYQPAPVAASLVKVCDRMTEDYARLIAASPFLALATIGPEGLDCSPRGDQMGFVRIADAKTLPTPGHILSAMTDKQVGGEAYDKAWPERARQTLW